MQQRTQDVYLLPLRDDGSPDIAGDYIYLPPCTHPNYKIRFQIEGTSSVCRQGSLWVNIPTKDQPFDRQKYHEYKSVALDDGVIEILTIFTGSSPTSIVP